MFLSIFVQLIKYYIFLLSSDSLNFGIMSFSYSQFNLVLFKIVVVLVKNGIGVFLYIIIKFLKELCVKLCGIKVMNINLFWRCKFN